MQTDDLLADTQKFRAAGVQINDPVPWSRKRPDGYELKWVLSLAQGAHRGVVPFLIQDVTPREERIPQKFDHPNGAKGIGTVTVAVEDVATVRHWYQSVLGNDGTESKRENLLAGGVRFRIGPHSFDFLRPETERSPLSQGLQKRGPSPCAATLVTSLPQPAPLDLSLTHGAALAFE